MSFGREFDKTTLVDNFVSDGYVEIKKVVPTELLDKLKRVILEEFQHVGKIHFDINAIIEAWDDESEKGRVFDKIEESLRHTSEKPFDILLRIWRQIEREKLTAQILQQEPLYSNLISLLGADLSYCDDSPLTVNIPDQTKQNYLFKDWHQELWSGADLRALQLWIPIFQFNNFGQMEFATNSHCWGHIPHQNRSPLKLPENMKITRTNLSEGDLAIFHSLTLHRSVPLLSDQHLRIALPVAVRNFREKSDAFGSVNRNWRIFSYSAHTKIERSLGNHYLSPFRITQEDDYRKIDGVFSDATRKKQP